jgi:hypothetical protein
VRTNDTELKMTEAGRKALAADYAKGEVSREDAENYPLLQRGNVRLVNDLYRTEKEEREFVDRALKLRLPGQKGYHAAGIWGFLRSFFVSSR